MMLPQNFIFRNRLGMNFQSHNESNRLGIHSSLITKAGSSRLYFYFMMLSKNFIFSNRLGMNSQSHNESRLKPTIFLLYSPKISSLVSFSLLLLLASEFILRRTFAISVGFRSSIKH